jgi:hypothetical protein
MFQQLEAFEASRASISTPSLQFSVPEKYLSSGTRANNIMPSLTAASNKSTSREVISTCSSLPASGYPLVLSSRTVVSNLGEIKMTSAIIGRSSAEPKNKTPIADFSAYLYPSGKENSSQDASLCNAQSMKFNALDQSGQRLPRRTSTSVGSYPTRKTGDPIQTKPYRVDSPTDDVDALDLEIPQVSSREKRDPSLETQYRFNQRLALNPKILTR